MSKKVTMVIEDTISFLTNPVCEFVSLVKRGANQAPFKVLKSEQGGKSMNKIVQAVLVPHSLSDDDKKKVLEGYRTDEVKEHDDFSLYVQVSKEDVVDGTQEMIELEGDIKVFAIKAQLKTDKEDPVPDDAQKAVEPVALGALYEDLFSTADIIAVALRQKDANPADLLAAINTAIDNFKASCSSALQTAVELKEVNPEEHPKLVYPIIKGDDPVVDDPADGEPSDFEVHMSALTDRIDDAFKAVEKDVTEIRAEFAKVPDMIAEAIKTVTAKVEETAVAVKALSPKVEEVEKQIDASKKRIKSYRTYAETVPGMEKKAGGVFNGTLFS